MKQADPFVIVPTFVIREAPKAISVYVTVRQYANYETGECFPKIDTIATELEVSRDTVERRIADLVTIGAMRKRRTGRSNRYTFPAQRYRNEAGSDTAELRQQIPHQEALNKNHSNETHLTREEDAGRRRDLLWEIFVEIHGEPATKSERGKYNAILKKLREGSVEPDEYPTLVAAYTEKHGGLQPAPATVAERIGEMRHFRDRGAIRVARTVEERERDRRFAALTERQELREAGYEGDG